MASVFAFENFAVCRQVRYQNIPDFQYVAFDYILIIVTAAEFLGNSDADSQYTIPVVLVSLRNQVVLYDILISFNIGSKEVDFALEV